MLIYSSSSSNYCTSTTFPAEAEAAKFQINHGMEEEEDVYLQFLQQVLYEDDDAAAAAAAVLPTPKKIMKKDRHSKINTARGPRDRRMRLSLDIARRFFRLQDLLGYDKASTTVNWLLNNAAPAIANLLHDNPPPNSPINHSSSSTTTNKIIINKTSDKVIKRRRVAVGRESRKMARQRARERTSQKRRLILLSHDHFNTSSSHLLTNYHQHSYFNQEEQEIQFGAWEAMGAFNSFHPSEL